MILKKTRKGYLDFLLLDDKDFPLAVLEAKRSDANPLIGKEQAREYAERKCSLYYIIKWRSPLFLGP